MQSSFQMDCGTYEESITQIEDCPICYAPLHGDIHKLECGHCFHTECAITWFRSGYDTCPMCRGFPHIKLKQIDITQRAKTIMRDVLENGNNQCSYELQEAVRKCKDLETAINLQRESFRNVIQSFNQNEKQRKHELLKHYRKLRDEFKSTTRPLLHELDHIDRDFRRKRKEKQSTISNMKRQRKRLLREIGLSGMT